MLLSAIFASMLFGLITSASFTVGGMFAAVVGMGGGFGGGMGYGMGGFNPMAIMMGSASGHMVGAGVGFRLVFALASAFVFLLPLMVGVLTWCEFSEKVDLDSIRQAADEKLQDMNNKMADLKEKAQVQPLRRLQPPRPHRRPPLPALRQSSPPKPRLLRRSRLRRR